LPARRSKQPFVFIQEGNGEQEREKKRERGGGIAKCIFKNMCCLIFFAFCTSYMQGNLLSVKLKNLSTLRMVEGCSSSLVKSRQERKKKGTGAVAENFKYPLSLFFTRNKPFLTTFLQLPFLVERTPKGETKNRERLSTYDALIAKEGSSKSTNPVKSFISIARK
jgi:hypothetical protein